MPDANEAFMTLESYCDYLLNHLRSPFPNTNAYTEARHITHFNELRLAIGLESIYSITEESIHSTLSVVGHGLVSAGKAAVSIGEVLLSGIMVAHSKIVDLTANADDLNKKSQVVLRNAKDRGVRYDGHVSVNGSVLQYHNKLSATAIIEGLREAKSRVPVYIEWATEHYTLAMEQSKFLPTHEKKFVSFTLPGDKEISLINHELSLHASKVKLKTDNKLAPTSLSELETIVELVHSLAGILRSTGFDTLLGKVKDYVKRTSDDKEVRTHYNGIFNPSATKTLVSVVDHLLDSCVAALNYCEKSTLG